jgi:hypothetical protein
VCASDANTQNLAPGLLRFNYYHILHMHISINTTFARSHTRIQKIHDVEE